MTGCKPHPSHTYLEKVSGDYASQYQQEDPPPPPGRPVPTHTIAFNIDYKTPSELEKETPVRWLRRNMAGGNTHFQAEHLQALLRGSYM